MRNFRPVFSRLVWLSRSSRAPLFPRRLGPPRLKMSQKGNMIHVAKPSVSAGGLYNLQENPSRGINHPGGSRRPLRSVRPLVSPPPLSHLAKTGGPNPPSHTPAPISLDHLSCGGFCGPPVRASNLSLVLLKCQGRRRERVLARYGFPMECAILGSPRNT